MINSTCVFVNGQHHTVLYDVRIIDFAVQEKNIGDEFNVAESPYCHGEPRSESYIQFMNNFHCISLFAHNIAFRLLYLSGVQSKCFVGRTVTAVSFEHFTTTTPLKYGVRILVSGAHFPPFKRRPFNGWGPPVSFCPGVRNGFEVEPTPFSFSILKYAVVSSSYFSLSSIWYTCTLLCHSELSNHCWIMIVGFNIIQTQIPAIYKFLQFCIVGLDEINWS